MTFAFRSSEVIIIIIIIPLVGQHCGSVGEPAGGVGCCTRGLGLGCDASYRPGDLLLLLK